MYTMRYDYEDYYTNPVEITKEQAHTITDQAANTSIKHSIHKKIDWMSGEFYVAKRNGTYTIYNGTINICELYNDQAILAIKSITEAK